MSDREDEFFFRIGRVVDAPAEWQDDEAVALLGKHWQPMAEVPFVGDASTREGEGYVEQSGADRAVIRDISDTLAAPARAFAVERRSAADGPPTPSAAPDLKAQQ